MHDPTCVARVYSPAMDKNSSMRGPWHQSGGILSGLLKIIVLVFIVSFVFGKGSQCMQQAPQMAGRVAAEVTNGVVDAAGTAAGNAWQRNVTGPIERGWDRLVDALFGVGKDAQDFWDNSTPAEKFELVCENVPVAGVDKLCPYFTAPLAAATDAQVERIACLWQAAGNSPNGAAHVRNIANTCFVHKNDPSALEKCMSTQIEPGDRAQCLASAPGQFFKQVARTIKPLACPPNTPGTPASCNPQPEAAAPAGSMRTDPPYMDCLRNAYNSQVAGSLPYQASCIDNPMTPPQWVQCVEGQLQARLPKAGAWYIQNCRKVR